MESFLAARCGVFQITGLILGKEHETVVLLFEKFRRRRNLVFYDSVGTANKGEGRKSAETAQKLIEAIQVDIKKFLTGLHVSICFPYSIPLH